MGTFESFDYRLTFESFGVGVTIESNDSELLDFAFNVAADALLNQYLLFENKELSIAKRFGLRFHSGRYELFQDGICTNSAESKAVLFKYYSSMLRLTIAENAVNRVFVHAGVVALNGKAVVFPARSFKGKTSIVAALLRSGAVYYSDEYAVFDLEGNVHPFPRFLSIRGEKNEFDEIDIPPEVFGAKIGNLPISVGSVILTEFVKGSRWSPISISIGEGILETIPHTIPLRSNTAMSLNVLNQAFENAIILKGPRGEAPDTATEIINFLNKNCN